MEIGDSFLLKDPSIDEHLWFVITQPQSDAEGLLVIANLTKRKDFFKDNSCILVPGDHDWIRVDSVIRYCDARIVRESSLDALVLAGSLTPMTTASDMVLAKIFAGAQITDELPPDCRKILEDQGLIDR